MLDSTAGSVKAATRSAYESVSHRPSALHPGPRRRALSVIVARGMWLRVVTSEVEAIDAARLMATPIEGPHCSDPIAYVDSTLHAG